MMWIRDNRKLLLASAISLSSLGLGACTGDVNSTSSLGGGGASGTVPARTDGASGVTGTGSSPSSSASSAGSSSASGGSSTGVASNVPFAPAPGALKRLTATSFVNTLTDLLGGPVTVGELEPDSWEVGGLATVGAGIVAISAPGVEDYQTAIEAVTTQAFANTAQRDKLIGCTPKSASDTQCFTTFVTQFGGRAFRQPLTAAQISRYTQMTATNAAALGDVYEALRTTMSAILQSPYFLYRLEQGAPATGQSYWQYTSTETATRLAYFLTNSTPDSTLLDLANQNGLQTVDAVRAQADRLLSTAAGRQSVGNFITELMQLGLIASRAKDPGAYPSYTPALQAGMAQEIPSMFESLVFDQKTSAMDLFTTHTTAVNKDLATLYGLSSSGMTSAAMTSATLPASGLRAGLFGTAGFLSLYATELQTSPTQRGLFIRTMILCETIPPPPPNVSAVLVDPPAGTVETKREQLTAHRASPTCASCHGLMDPLGLTLENFDTIGQFRTTDQGLPIDVSGDLDGTAFNGPIELGQIIAKQPATSSCMLQNLYQYATGHVIIGSEGSVINDLTQRFRSGGYQLRDLMLDLVTSDGFRYVAAATP